MRYTLPFLTFVAASTLSIFACTDDDGNAGSGIDGGPNLGGIDGGDGGGLSETGANPTSGNITVTVRRAGVAAALVRVLFHDANGAVIGDHQTDANGVVVGAAPKQVTVVGADPATQGAMLSLVTYADVVDGDALLVDIPAAPSTPPTMGSYRVNITPPPNAMSYEVRTGHCSAEGDTGPLTIALREDCRGSKGSVLGVATTNGGTMLAHLRDLALPAAGVTSDVGLITWYTPKKATIKINGLGPVEPGGATLDLFADGVSYPEIQTIGAPTAPGGEVVTIPDGLEDEYLVHAAHDTKVPSTPSQRHYLRRKRTALAPGMGSTGDLVIDFQVANATPAIDVVTRSMPVPGRPEVMWTIEAPSTLTTVHAAYTLVQWKGSETFPTTPSWLFIVDPLKSSVKAPELPADLTTKAPGAGADLTTNVYLVSSSLAPSFGAMKKLPMDAALSHAITDAIALPTEGEIYYSRSVNTP